MKNFKIGDKVIALSDPTHPILSQPRVKGQQYIVKGIIYCCGCGKQSIHIQGNAPDDTRDSQCVCGSVQSHNGLMWTDSIWFVKADLKAIKKELQEAIVVEDYDSAILLRDIKLN